MQNLLHDPNQTPHQSLSNLFWSLEYSYVSTLKALYSNIRFIYDLENLRISLSKAAFSAGSPKASQPIGVNTVLPVKYKGDFS